MVWADGHPGLDGGFEERENVQASSLKSSQYMQLSPQLLCAYCVPCTTEAAVWGLTWTFLCTAGALPCPGPFGLALLQSLSGFLLRTAVR